jgi:hypothetical protein
MGGQPWCAYAPLVSRQVTTNIIILFEITAYWQIKMMIRPSIPRTLWWKLSDLNYFETMQSMR